MARPTETGNTSNSEDGFVVLGTIKRPGGKPVRGAIVKAYDKGLRGDPLLLGGAKTDAAGKYELTYSRKPPDKGEQRGANLVVRVVNEQNDELASSGIIFNARSIETVDVVVPDTRSEYARLSDALLALVKQHEVGLTELTEDELTFLAGQSGEERRHIELFVLAEKLSVEADRQSRQSHEAKRKRGKAPDERYLAPEILYGLVRQNLPTTLTALLAQQRQVHKHALDLSRRRNIIRSAMNDDEMSTALAKLRSLALNRALKPDDDQDKPGLRAVLDASALPKEKHGKFADLYLDHDGPIDNFWRTLQGHPEFSESEVADLRLTFELRTLTLNHLPMLRELKQHGPSGSLKSVRDLAVLDEAGWKKLIRKKVGGVPIGFPRETPGNSDEERIDHYARSLVRAMELAVPTAVFAASFRRDGISGTEEVKGTLDVFFADNPDFDLRNTYIEKYFGDKTTLNNLPNRAAVIDRLKRIQRVFKLTPRFGDARVLLEGGIHSARQIAYMGRSTFVQMYGQRLGGGQRDAALVWRRAERRAVGTMLMEMRHGWQNNQPQIAVVPSPPAQVGGIPNWSNLLGSVSYCECEHCRSVYSPAAYLVDLLHFIVDEMTLIGTEPAPARDVLFHRQRRPDIQDIELTCRNTNTLVPYVDLVNEILENAIAPGQHDERWPQTDGTAEELSVNPEHFNHEHAAYTALRNAIYPLSLPWDPSVEEVRSWLHHLGVDRHELMRVFQRSPDGGEEPNPTNLQIATEYLRLTTKERELITGAFQASHPWLSWGLDEDDNPVPRAEHPDEIEWVGWFEALRRVPIFMERAGLRYEQLQELLDLAFINPALNDGPRIRLVASSSCNLNDARIDRLRGEDLDKSHRFLRLWRRLGWTMRELDQAIAALDRTELTDELLCELSHVQRLRIELALPLDVLLTWWGTIDSRRYVDRAAPGQPPIPTLYERLFRNPTVLKPLPDSPFTEDPEQLAGDLSDHTGPLCAALGISPDDLSLLLTHPLVLPSAADDDTQRDQRLNLTNLSALYRHSMLARALGLPIADYLSLRHLVPTDPFASTAGALRFIEQVGKVRSSPLRIAELNYLLRHEFAVASAIAPDAASMVYVLRELREGLQKIANAAPPVVDDDQEAIRLIENRKQSFIKERVATALGLESSIAASLLESALGQQDNAERAMERFLGLASAEGLSAVYYDTPNLVGTKVRRTDPQVSFDWGIESPAAGIPADAFSARWSGKVLPQYSESYTFHVRSDDGCRLWVNTQLLIDEWHDQEVTEHSASVALTAGQFYDITLEYYENGMHAVAELSWSSPSTPKEIIPETRLYPAEREEDAVRLWALLHKVALVINRLEMTAREVVYVSEHGDRFDGFDFNAFPIAATTSPTPSFASWERLLDFFRLRDLLPGATDTLIPTLGLANGDVDALLDALCENSGWNPADLGFLVTEEDGLRLRYPEDFQNGHALSRLHACLALTKRLGASARQCRQWSQPMLGHADVDTARQSVKSKYDQERWLAVARPVQDMLREKRRTALVAYLTSHSMVDGRAPFKDANELFDHFLIDVEMGPCMMTSRIKQAISSVQLFIQRCLMNLEPAGYPDPGEDWAVFWTWMKNYRVWEANRKVFLYPENWIEPELRDGKSPFFRELENELLQNEVTAETAEAAFRNYLEKLDVVARLEVCGLYHQVEEDANLLHVFARTRAKPYVYYYRRRVDATYWTPWERVDLDIQSDHLIPVVWHRRLYLFWPIFTEKALEVEPPAQDAGNEDKVPRKYREIQLAWSEYKNKWSPKKVSTEVATKDPSANPMRVDQYHESGFFFDARANDESLTITCKYAAGREGAWFTFKLSSFTFASCDGTISVKDLHDGDLLLLPSASHVNLMKFTEDDDVDQLSVISGDVDRFGDFISNTERYVPLLGNTPGTYSIVYPHQFRHFVSQAPFFYEDATRTFFVTPRAMGVIGAETMEGGFVEEWKGFFFSAFYHPYVCAFIKQLNRLGLDGLLNWNLQNPVLQRERDGDFFDAEYHPQPAAVEYPIEDVDVLLGGAYSLYNWELFFHAPLLIADRLTRNQRFEEAQKWFHYIFDPTDRSADERPQRYWKFRKFYEDASNPIQTLEELLSDAQKLEDEVDQWRLHPFNPHQIARTRIGAYQKTVVMKYLDNLIAWGDQLFRRETLESVNEAALLYVLAAECLGSRPVRLPSQPVEPMTYRQAGEGRFNALSNPESENYFEFPERDPAVDGFDVRLPDGLLPGADFGIGQLAHANVVTSWYFCNPPNDKLLGYWDTVADRLFKLRHCMNIEGVVRQLPLFEPPIEPGLLVRAAAMGVDISSALNDFQVALPHYRFNVMLQKALELCNDVRTFGAALLSALEKRDAEELALLRSGQETQLLTATRQIKEQQITEATDALAGIEKSQFVVAERLRYYQQVTKISSHEKLYVDDLKDAHFWQQSAQATSALAAAAHLIPNWSLGISGWAGSPVAVAKFGGLNVGSSLQAASGVASFIASEFAHSAALASIEGGYERRWDEWKLQERLAKKELDQIDKQRAAAEIRLSMATKDLENHDKQVENSKAVDEYMRSKFTDQELYDWTVGQASAMYFQAYQFAYDVARRAEKAYRHELGITESSFIQFGYWDSLRKGLLAGERLYFDLRRMEIAYLEQNTRDYEIAKHISLAQVAPAALMQLKANGACEVELPELLFDMDFPGHYFRRVKSVSLSIPCVVGPYTSVNATLTLERHSVRRQPRLEDERETSYASLQSIATSSAQNDSGLFELNFHDERYLPFEGAGAISTWSIDLPKEFNYFDFDTISDVVMHLRYTARKGDQTFHDANAAAVQRALPGAGVQLLDLKHGFATAWHRFIYPAAGADQELTFNLSEVHFPFYARKGVEVTRIEVLAELAAAGDYEMLLTVPQHAESTLDLVRDGMYRDLHHAITPESSYPLGTWKLNVRAHGANDFRALGADEVRNLCLIVAFNVTR